MSNRIGSNAGCNWFILYEIDRGKVNLIYFSLSFLGFMNSRLDPAILSSINPEPYECPVFAQIIGENTEDINRTVS